VNEQRSLQQHFFGALLAMVIKMPIAIILTAYIAMTIKAGVLVGMQEFGTALRRYGQYEQMIYWLVMWPLLLFVLTVYPYARERKPSYIKKMQEQEERQSAKEAEKHQTVVTDPAKNEDKGNNA
jgi:nitrate/nitrite transporter NarK